MEIIENQSFEPIIPHPAPPLDLTEDEVKKLFVPFLREFYKYRYAIEPGTSMTTFDNLGEGGIVADGKLTFLKTDDEDPEKRQFFTCTFEATSRDKMQEIKYEPNIGYLIWDSVAFAGAFTTAIYVLSYIMRTNFLYRFGAVGNLGMVVAVWFMLYSFWFFLMKNWRKYRYIFAINQFKQYFADEQWCAIAGDIFALPTDPFLVELKEQCMFNGFGLAVVERDGSVRPIATPSRLGMYGRDRKMIDWVTANKYFQKIAAPVQAAGKMREKLPDELTVVFNKLWNPIQFYLISPLKNTAWKIVAKPFGVTSTIYSRWQGSYTTQKSVTVLSLAVMFFFLYKTLQHKSLEFADDDYFEKIGKRISGENPEDYRGYIVDGEPIKYGAIPKQYPDSELPNDDDVQTIDLSGDGEDENIQTIDLSGDGEIDEKTEFPPEVLEEKPAEKVVEKIAEKPAVSLPTKKPRATTPCNLVSSKKGWLVQDGYFSDKSFADERLGYLTHRGLKAFVVPGSCVDKNSVGYFIFWGDVLSTETAARSELDDYRKTLSRYSLLFEKPPILRHLK